MFTLLDVGCIVSEFGTALLFLLLKSSFFPALRITLTPPETPPQNQTLINTLDSNMVMIILKYEFDVFLVTGWKKEHAWK